ncbi:SusC/RagA family TonB-linked outer membrane protein [Marinoscillum furvescens]|uniref:TonB-linked SusC/RagA family outer membrane protein n=1 Tax=Marinoscillum furvescens DSM 4134 TaxID=1122208 RepID=A0A3D9L1F2_MARFU|nr:TonB-dependent receptor [Marinoscillum furvescens]RED95973.1 TonB-linked SusC/RagA family outer membrane protein [Marinoscillum furvescens DSM 4134]
MYEQTNQRKLRPFIGSVVLLWVALFGSISVNAQEVSISGVVTDEYGEGLPGAAVIEKGTTNGITTDLDGQFKLSVSENAILVISYVGYTTEEVAVNNRTNFDIQLLLDVEALEEVVVVGYGEQSKQTLTGAVEQVTERAFKDRAVTNPALALQGQTPGLVVTRTTPRPGGRSDDGIDLQIRGATSVNGGEPLVVIDGVPVMSAREFYQMNPDDIASVSILKDGAASIYGSRAANGVILVTTKRGEGKMKVGYNANFRINTIGIRPPGPSMVDYATLWLDAGVEDAPNTTYWGWLSKENLERMQQGKSGIYPTVFWGDVYIGDHDRFDQLFGTSFSHQHNISVSGASEKSRYRLSGAFADNQTALKTAYDGQKQYNIRFNYDYDINSRLSLTSGITYQRTVTSGPSSGLSRELGAFDPPFFPAKTPDGHWYANFNVSGNRNAVASTTDGGRENFTEDLTKINLGAEFKILEGLTANATMSFNKRVQREDVYRLTVQPYTWDGNPSAERINGTPLIAARNYDRNYMNYGSFFNYEKSFDKHNLKAMAGITADLQEDRNLYAERKGIQNQGVYDINVAPVDAVSTAGGQSHWGLLSYVSKFNYDYNGKYLLELVGRRDGSSRFSPENRWSNYGSVSLGWVISDEAFMKAVPFVSFFKLRGSYGELGNFVGIGLYDYVSTISQGTLPIGVPPTLRTTARVSGLTSDTRTWERVKMTNAGADLTFLDNRITGSLDYYIKENDGMLIEVVYPDVLGGNAPKSNSGNLLTKGWEAVIGWKDQVNSLQYNASFNISDSRNELIEFEGSPIPSEGRNQPLVGYPLNSYFLYPTDGLFQSQDEVDAYYETYTQDGLGEIPTRDADPSVVAASELRPGDTKIIDHNGDGKITIEDLKYMGDSAPHYTFGLNLGASWKGFDFQAMFQGVMDQNVVRTGLMKYPFYRIWTNQTTAYMGQTWTESNPDASYPRLTTNTQRGEWNWDHKDFMMMNNRYVRLKVLVVGYTLPTQLVNKAGMEKVRIYFSGNDLFELTSLKDGYDPEFGESTDSTYPYNRTWSFGLDVSF